MKIKFMFVISISLSWMAGAQVRPLRISTEIKKPSPRWMFEKSEVVTSKGFARSLYFIRNSKNKKRYDRCLNTIAASWKRAAAIQPWLLVEELECARNLSTKNSRWKSIIRAAILKVDKNPNWLIAKPYSKFLRSESVKAHLALLVEERNSSRKRAWKVVDRLQQMRSWLSAAERAKVYRIAGEMAFLQQNLLLAEDYLIRSLNEKESRELERKLTSIRKSISLSKLTRTRGRASNFKKTENKKLEPSEREFKLYSQFQNFLKTGDWVSALEDGISLIKEFPGGRRAEYVQNKIIRVYRKVAIKRDEKWILIKQRILRLMKKSSGENLFRWGESAFGWGNYSDSYELANGATEKLRGAKLSTDAHLLAARAANTIGEYGFAEEHYRTLVTEHSGSEKSLEALFRWGLIKFRLKKYPQAIAKFQRLQNITSESKFDLQARYWHWRSLQKLEDSSAGEIAKNLYERYPLTYYGIRALSETSGLDDFLKTGTGKLETTLWLSEGDNRIWERFLLLLSGGWFKEAQEELSHFPTPDTPEENIIYSKLWGLAFHHYRAVLLAQKGWDQDRSLLNRSTIHLAYPLEFRSFVKKWSKKNELDAFKVFALIKQESSFRREVSSGSGAVGLMQLMMPTAREINDNLKARKSINRMSLTDAELNIRFGSYYLKRLLRAYDGHFPLALAGYNVGIGNMRKWLRSRPVDFKGITSKGSQPENEIWMDELAWSETSYYVKAVMRNYLIYQILHKSLKSVPSPSWEGSK